MGRFSKVLIWILTAGCVWGAWILPQYFVVWIAPDPVKFDIDILLYDWLASFPQAWALLLYTIVSVLFFHGVYRVIFRRGCLWRALLSILPPLLYSALVFTLFQSVVIYHENKYYNHVQSAIENQLGEELQVKVNAMRKLVAEGPHPKGFDVSINKEKLNGNTFNINRYFLVLTNLSVTSGYVFDYIHLEGSNGYPVLYGQKDSENPLLTADEYIRKFPLKEFGPPEYILGDWSSAVELNPTSSGYLELAALHLIGNQFYLYWHANYNDRVIIASTAKLEEVLNSENLIFNGGLPIGYRIEATKLNVRPSVEVAEDAVWVSLLTFSKWGGFVRVELAISKEHPHKILLEESETLIDYVSGILF